MSIPLWMSIEPLGSEVRLMLTSPAQGTVLKARLPNPPQHPRAVIALLEAISFWHRQPLHAVVDADAEASSPRRDTSPRLGSRRARRGRRHSCYCTAR
jgi:hypothetical protein